MLSPEQIALIQQCASDEQSQIILRDLFLKQARHHEEALKAQERLYRAELKESDDALQGSIDQYRRLIETSPDGILITVGTVVYYGNPVMAEMLGAESPEQLVGKTVFDLLHSSQHQAIQERINLQGHDSEHVRQRQEQFVRFDGTTIDVEVSITSIQIDKAPATLTTVRDITDRKQTERQMDHFRSQLVELQQLSLDLGRLDSMDELCRQAVEQGREFLGVDRFSLWFLSADQTLMLGTFGTDPQGRTIDERDASYLVTQDNLPRWLNRQQPLTVTRHRDLFDTHQNIVGHGWIAEAALFRGDELIGLINADNLRTQKPPTEQQLELLSLYSLTLGQLVSRMRVAEERSQSEARYRAVFENAQIGISITSAQGKSVSMNPYLCAMLGYSPDELCAMTFAEYTHPDDSEYNLKLFHELLRGQRSHYKITKRFVRKDGSSLPVRLTVTPFPHEEDEDKLVLAMIEDVTVQMQAQMRLLESETRHRALLAAVPDMYFRFDAEGIYQDCHVPDPSLLFMPTKDQIGKHYSEVLPSYLAEPTDKHFKLAVRTSEMQTFDVPVERNGRLHHFEHRIVAYDANQVLIVVREMTERIEAMQQLKESEERFQQFAANIDEMIYLLDAIEDQVLYVNEAYERLWQLPRSELYADMQSFRSRIHPEDKELIRQLSLHTPGGSEVEYRIVLPDGQVRWLWSRNFPISDENGVVQRVAGVTKDITERKEMETTHFKIAVQQERMKLLSDFVRDISHAFRTPLSLINSKLYLARKTRDSDEQERHLDGIEEQARRILNLVESLVTMIRLDSGTEFETSSVKSDDLLRAVEASHEKEAAEAGVDFVVKLNPDLPPMQANLEELATALSHLLKNAIQHTEAGGSITMQAWLESGDQIAIDVQDTGSGIPREDLPRIFDRFYRGSDSQNTLGFGLGLPIVERIIEGHAGRITVSSEPGHGSTFTLLLPLARHHRV